MKWLAECSVAALREALAAVAPELGGYPVTVPGGRARRTRCGIRAACLPVTSSS